jgi:hypothetical protein
VRFKVNFFLENTLVYNNASIEVVNLKAGGSDPGAGA